MNASFPVQSRYFQPFCESIWRFLNQSSLIRRAMFGSGVLEGHLNEGDEGDQIIIELGANPLSPPSRPR